jgi:hypothetical protein
MCEVKNGSTQYSGARASAPGGGRLHDHWQEARQLGADEGVSVKLMMAAHRATLRSCAPSTCHRRCTSR